MLCHLISEELFDGFESEFILESLLVGYVPLFYAVYKKVSEISDHKLKNLNTKNTLDVPERSCNVHIS
jgi:hypothetical protein